MLSRRGFGSVSRGGGTWVGIDVGARRSAALGKCHGNVGILMFNGHVIIDQMIIAYGHVIIYLRPDILAQAFQVPHAFELVKTRPPP